MFHLDFETRSRADLKKVGAARYANDPSTEILCVAIAKDDEEPLIWCCEDSWVPDDEEAFIPPYGWGMQSNARTMLHEISGNPEALVFAHNATFEIFCADALWLKTFGCPPPRHDQWRCTMAMARRAALPPSLDKCSQALNLTQKKDARGGALIRKFCVPQKSGSFINPADEPEAFKELCDYCVQDVRVEREIHKKLHAFELKGFSLQTFQLDIAINSRGFPVNLEGLRLAQVIVNEETEKLAKEFKALTGIEHTQNAKFLVWLKERGFKHSNLQAATMEEVFEEEEFDESTELGKALMIKKRVSFASLKKIPAMLGCAGPHDNRVRGTLIWGGTGPGRWSAVLVQPQNFKRPSIKNTEAAYQDICDGCTAAWLELIYGPPLEVISSCIRHFIHDKPNQFLDADYSAIQARTVCWLAGQDDAVEDFRNGVDRYCKMASVLYGRQVNKHDHSFPERFIGKQIVLGCGFGMGGPKFRVTCEKLGYHDLEEDLEFKAVNTFRETHPKVVELWRSLETAAKAAIKAPGQKFDAGEYLQMFCTTTAGMKYLFLKLPSGRKIAYPDPKLEQQIRWKTINKETGEEVPHVLLNPTPDQVAKVRQKDPKARLGETITFFGQITGKAIWGRVSTYGGKLAENATMGVETDVMMHGLIVAEADGFEVATVVHDEAISYKEPEQTIERFVECLTTLPAWADGLPVAAEGAVIPFYKK